MGAYICVNLGGTAEVKLLSHVDKSFFYFFQKGTAAMGLSRWRTAQYQKGDGIRLIKVVKLFDAMYFTL